MESNVWGGTERTGGGKPPPPPNATSQRILELFGDEPGFSGIEGGIESGQCEIHMVKLLIHNKIFVYIINGECLY